MNARLLVFLFFFSTTSLKPAVTMSPPSGSVRFDQVIGSSLPLDDLLIDHEGKTTSLRSVFNGSKPVILVFGYFHCPQLCSVVVSGVIDSLRQIAPNVGRDYSFVYVSIDSLDTWQEAAKLRTEEAGRYGRGSSYSGWHYFVGPKASITALTRAAGFHFTEDIKNRQYAHPSGFIVLTPKGVVSRYFLGLDSSSAEVAAALRRAAAGKTGESVYDLLLLCARGDRISGRYGAIIWRSLQIAVSLTVLGLAVGIGWMLREERQRTACPSPVGEEETLR